MSRSQGKTTAKKTSGKKASANGRSPTVDMVKQLAQILDKFGLSELEVKSDEAKIWLRRGDAPAATVLAQPTLMHAAPAAPAPAPAPAAPAQPPASEESNLHTVTSPFVGTFYRAPNPDASAYVQVGDRVEKGQTLCIVEAMKLMNEIEADQGGVVATILVENGEPVEYGQALFKLSPS
jgi:acetyl-CoA carboxylase biotin carboxyl carrier protein